MDKVTFAGFTSPAIVVDRAAIAAKRAKDPHFQKMEKAEHIIEYIEGKVRKYAWGFDKKAGRYRDYSKKEYESLKAAGKTCTDF